MYKSIQAGRGVAALTVVLYHTGKALAFDEKYFREQAFFRPFAFGNAGVEFFFVLSGLVITLAHWKDFGHPHRLWRYLYNRITRIYPAYVLVFVAVLGVSLLLPSVRQTVPLNIWTLLKGILLLPQDPEVVGGNGAPVLNVAWSLQYEMFFYALIAFLILNRILGVAVWLILLILTVFCYGWDCRFPFSFIGSEWGIVFWFGVASAYIAKSHILIQRPRMLVWVGGLACAALALIEDVSLGTQIALDRRMIWALFCSVVMIGLVRAEQSNALTVRSRWALLLGDASYALYLIHYPMISLVCKVLIHLGLRGFVGAAIAYPSIVLACIGSAVIFHLKVERPIMRYFSRLKSRFIVLNSP